MNTFKVLTSEKGPEKEMVIMKYDNRNKSHKKKSEPWYSSIVKKNHNEVK